MSMWSSKQWGAFWAVLLLAVLVLGLLNGSRL